MKLLCGLLGFFLILFMGCQRSAFIMRAHEMPCYIIAGLTTYDLKTQKTYTFDENIADIIGQDMIKNFWKKLYPNHYDGFTSFSRTGHYIAADSITDDLRHDSKKLLIIDVVKRKAEYFSLENRGMKFLSCVWSPSESKLLMELKSDDKKSSFQLGLLERNAESKWQLKILPITFEEGTDCPISYYPWISEDRIMYENSGKLFEYNLKTSKPRFIRKGYLANVISENAYIFSPDRTPSYPVSPAAPAKSRTNILVQNDREVILKPFLWPVISPNGKFLLYDDTEMTSVWGHAAFKNVYYIYDIGNKRQYKILDGSINVTPMSYGVTKIWLELTPETKDFYWPN